MCIRDRDKVAEEFIRDHGATPTFKGFPNQYGEPFPASLCTSVNEQVVHGIPGDIVPVSYTHLTLPTIYSVVISEVAESLKKKKITD